MESEDHFEDLINHLFLPPKIPQDNDERDHDHVYIIHRVLEAVSSFRDAVEADLGVVSRPWRTVEAMMRAMADAHVAHHLTEEALAELLIHLRVDGILPLHITAQNAGLIIRKPSRTFITVESFEVSLPAATVTGAEGKLVACFPPAPRLNLPNHRDLIVPLSALLADLDVTVRPDAMPSTIKAGSKQVEIRDTADPRYVTELIGGIARAYTDDIDAAEASTVYVTKRLADRVLWKDALLPWRRSAKWLLIRVALQTTLRELDVEDAHGYKIFIGFLLAGVLDDACARGLSADLVYVMNAKLARRMYKIKELVCSHAHTAAIRHIAAAVEGARVYLDNIAAEIRAEQDADFYWRVPTEGEIEDGLNLSMRNSGDFLRVLHGRRTALEGLGEFFDAGMFSYSLRRESPIETPPNITIKGSATEKLECILAIERWVTEDLATWSRHTYDYDLVLVRLMAHVLETALTTYKHNPEILSRMLLMTLEMWVVLDRITVERLPLLGEYSPEIPKDLLDPLLLATASEMKRLKAVEVYLAERHSSMTPGSPSSIYSLTPSADSFAARYFDSDGDLRNIRTMIRDTAARDIAIKTAELAGLKSRRDELLAEAAAMTCETVRAVDRRGNMVFKHPSDCPKCARTGQANRIWIEVYEYPLPHDETESKWAVFEARIPHVFSVWRHITNLILQSLSAPAAKDSEAVVYIPLLEYWPLRPYAWRSSIHPSLSLASNTKSFLGSHYRLTSVLLDDSVIKNNPLHLRPYDFSRNQWLSRPEPDIRALCAYTLPRGPYQSLEWTLPSTTHLPNEVIARQSRCPAEISLHEWDAFGHLRAGHRLQWRNVLVALHTGELTFSHPAVHLLVRQTVRQAEQDGGDNSAVEWRRESHVDLLCPRFCTELIAALRSRLAFIRENWQEGWTATTLSVVATRLLALTADPNIRMNTLAYLADLRYMLCGWLQDVIRTRESRLNGTTVDEASESTQSDDMDSTERIVQIAATIRSTFDVDYSILPLLFAETDALSTFLECGFLIQSFAPASSSALSPIMQLLLERDRMLAIAAYPILLPFTWAPNSALSLAVQKIWPDFATIRPWMLVHVPGSWVTTTTVTYNNRQMRYVFVNLVDGQLLIDGRCIGTLPTDITGDPTFKLLFPHLHAVDCIPSTMKGMSYQMQRQVEGRSIHFLRASTGLIIRTSNAKGNVAEFVPPSKLSGDIPRYLETDLVSWFTESTEYRGNWRLDFMSHADRWSDISAALWTIKCTGSTGQTRLYSRDGTETVLDPHSRPVELAFSVFDSLEASRLDLLVTVRPWSPGDDSGHLTRGFKVRLPRFNLTFFVNADGLLECRDIAGSVISSNQRIGSLYGLCNTVVLQDPFAGTRRLIVPFAEVKIQSSTASPHEHPVITVALPPSTKHIRFFIYEIDEILGRLKVEDGTLTSRLYLIYLHVLTSSYACDTLTAERGIERALTMLQEASTISFMHLDEEDTMLLDLLASLTPVREYYPEHLTAMETEQWHSHLSPLAQHDRLAPLVRDILDHADMIALFDGKQSAPARRTTRGSETLRRKAEYRGQCIRPSLLDEPLATYHPSDTVVKLRGSPDPRGAEANVFEIAWLVRQWPAFFEVPVDIWSIISHWTDVEQLSLECRLSCPGIWLTKPLEETWLTLLHLCRQAHRSDTYGLMFTLAVVTFCQKPGEQVLARALLAVAVLGDTQNNCLAGQEPPFSMTRAYNLGNGVAVCREDIEAVAEEHLASFEDDDSWSDSTRESVAECYRHTRDTEIARASSDIIAEWPSARVSTTHGEDYELLDFPAFAAEVSRLLFEPRYPNHLLFQHVRWMEGYLNHVCSGVPRLQPPTRPIPRRTTSRLRNPHELDCLGLVLARLTSPPEDLRPQDLQVSQNSTASSHHQNNIKNNLTNYTHLTYLVTRLGSTGIAARYSRDLESSISALSDGSASWQERSSGSRPVTILSSSLEDAQLPLDYIVEATQARTLAESLMSSADLWPRTSTMGLLSLLRFGVRRRLSEPSKATLLCFAEEIARRQRELRLKVLFEAALYEEHRKESESIARSSAEYPDWILIQIDGHFATRPVQATIAHAMMHPESNRNAVMQLNMGEGKSSVIVPIISSALADGKTLVRVQVLKPLATQMFQLLRSQLGGLANRRIFYLPFHRGVKLDETAIDKIKSTFQLCSSVGGILLAQPEQILSLKLMALNRLQACSPGPLSTQAVSLLSISRWLDENSRDILDESDELLHTRYQLIYTVGHQTALDGQPDRWLIVEEVFSVLQQFIPHVLEQYPSDVEITWPGDEASAFIQAAFPVTRILDANAGRVLLDRCAHQIIYDDGLMNLRVPGELRDNALQFITQFSVDPAIGSVLQTQLELRREATTFKGLLLLRGLFAHGLLLFALSQKRWRVDYGLDLGRSLMAVPYRAKDSPSLRSEYGHPDVRLILTILSYYYGGLSDAEMDATFVQLFKSENPALLYEHWVKQSRSLPQSLRTIKGLNLADQHLKLEHIYPHFRYNKATIDFYMSSFVFPREAKEFPHKMTTNGWDLACPKRNLVTGFSGTNDQKWLLPCSIEQTDSRAQLHTNAQVLDYLLRAENREVLVMPPDHDGHNARAIIRRITSLKPSVRVLLDVGAQVLEYQNDELAVRWLEMESTPSIPPIEAAVYFDKRDELRVVNRAGRVEMLARSVYKTRLQNCLVYLDDAHTRGTDLRFPLGTRAAVTLGPRLTKEKLVQGCMRMRNLGRGHSVVFLAPEEVVRSIQKHREDHVARPLDSSDVLAWAMSETCQQIEENLPMWRDQGLNFDIRQQAWEEYSDGEITTAQYASTLREPEARSLQELYGVSSVPSDPLVEVEVEESTLRKDIRAQCAELGVKSVMRAQVHEEQERELDPEHELERQVRRAKPGSAASHKLAPDVLRFATTGSLSPIAGGFVSLSQALAHTGATALVHWDHTHQLLASADFVRTIVLPSQPSARHGAMNDFLRPVRWVLTSQTSRHVLLISPHEANELLPHIRRSSATHLHLYAPRVSRAMRPLDGLDVVPVPPTPFRVPHHVLHELGLFAGQLFLESYDDYRVVRKSAMGSAATSEAFKELYGYRRKGEGYILTHMGQLLRGRELQKQDFE